jgi:uncharacterized membrane protein (UPF0127 family)
MRGLMGRRGLPAGEGLLLSPAPAIHTAFMRFPIDALFLGRDLQVLEVVERLRPWRAASKRGARSVLELPAGESARRGVKIGDRLELRDRSAADTEPTGPAAEVDAPAVDVVTEPTLDWDEAQVARLRPLRILIISSDRRFRTVMSVLLARRNCSVSTTGNAARLGGLVARERSDVVVVDVAGSLGEVQLASVLDMLAKPIGVVVVADDPTPGMSDSTVLAKWGPFDELMAAIERADEHRGTRVVQR